MSSDYPESQPAQAVTPGAAPIQRPSDDRQGDPDLVDPAKAAGAELEGDPDGNKP